MFMRSAGPMGPVFNNGQGFWGPLPNTTFAFDLANPNLFLNQHLQSLQGLSAKQAAFRAGLQNMAPGRNETFQGHFGRQRTAHEQYQLQANDFDQSGVWFQKVRRPCSAFPSLLCSMSREIMNTDLGFSYRWKTPMKHSVDRVAMAMTLLSTNSHRPLAIACTMSHSHPRAATIIAEFAVAAKPI